MDQKSICHLMCLVCQKPIAFKNVPDKCADCGESVFINLKYIIQSFEMYPTKEEVLKKKPEPEVRDIKAETKNNEEFSMGVFAGYVGRDDEDDVDFFASLENPQFMVWEGVMTGQSLIITPFLKEMKGFQHNPCVIVAEDLDTKQIIHRVRTYFDRPNGYRAGKVIYSTTNPLVINHNGPVKVKIYTDILHLDLEDFDVDVT